MKELSIEEKARRYDEVVDEIKNLRDMLLKEGVINKDGVICDNFNRIFPELKESDDEKVRKEILEFFSQFENGELRGVDISSWIAYLEKQGEKGINGKNREIPFSEQKPADKVEPKFKVGQTIKKKDFNLGFTIVKIEDGFYYNDKGDYFPFTDEDNWELVEQKPVECNIWKDTKKELPKADSLILAIDDLGVIRTEYYEGDGYLSKDENIKLSTHHTKWCYQSEAKEIKQPVEWSEKDECMLSRFLNCIGHYYADNFITKEQQTLMEDWLKSRIPQKQELSKEDDRMIKVVKEMAYTIAQTSDKQFLERHGTNEQELKNWSLSCSPQNTWKPSDEQMKALWVTFMGGEEQAALASLYNDLKKLK